MANRYASFSEFYPFYLSEHASLACRRLHFVGTSLVLGCIVAAIVTGHGWWLAAAPFAGYGFAWVGHFYFEHNRPATFVHPFYSLLGDCVMSGHAHGAHPVLSGLLHAAESGAIWWLAGSHSR